jgi:2-(1,2-epoxy-1,2-dihydrophenyl)acetyl-CoA isomerase
VTDFEHVAVTPADGDHVAVVEMLGAPNHFLDIFVLRDLVSALTELDRDVDCRAIVVRSEGKHFCAGRNFGATRSPEDTSESVYRTARSLLELSTPWVAELTGGSIGAGLGLAMCADHRVAAESAYLAANFVRLGLHHGFGLSATLPRIIGIQRATEMLSSGRRVGMAEAVRIGLVDEVVPVTEVAGAAFRYAALLAAQPPLALAAVRSTMRDGLAESFTKAVARELSEQIPLTSTADFKEAAAAARERRPAIFTGS